MSWRFRKSFTVIPGVRLNLSRQGMSVTVGGSPLSLNVGPHGTYANVTIPGTGVSERLRLDAPTQEPSTPPHDGGGAHGASPVPALALSQIFDIHSASTETIHTASLNWLRDLLKNTDQQRRSIEGEISAAERELSRKEPRFSRWDRGFLFKRLFKTSFAQRREEFERERDRLAELREQLKLTTLATQFEMSAEQADPYFKMRDSFGALTECPKAWDTLSRQNIDRIKERSAASQVVRREEVRLSLAHSDLIQWEQAVPFIPNRVGGDMYIYPGFILYRASRESFALVDARDVAVQWKESRFIETEGVPHGTPVVGQAWAKSNKDGSPDRRFKGNFQMPIALYGDLTFASSSGLHEEYQFSDFQKALRFAAAWETFRGSLGSPTR